MNELGTIGVLIMLMAGWAISADDASEMAASIRAAALAFSIDAEELVAVAWQESRFQITTGDGGRACGPMQIHPRFAVKAGTGGKGRYTCDELMNARTGIYVGAETLARLRRRWPKTYLGHYNTGNVYTDKAARYDASIKRRREKIAKLKDDRELMAERLGARLF